ncbi:hypothetical protein MLPF_1436 [Mycobacterium lepromatosis]|nr:hypothetical protein MLPF_1436 [Mycobacterium lepromatosis]
MRIRDCPAAVCRNDRRLEALVLEKSETGKRWPLEAPSQCAPASPKTCRLCRARRVRRLIASWNGLLAGTVAVMYLKCCRNRIGCASAGGGCPVDLRMKSIKWTNS